MSKRLNISTGLAPCWSQLAEAVRDHKIWHLDEEAQPTIHLRAKANGGLTFSSWLANSPLQIFQAGGVATVGDSWNVETISGRVLTSLEHAYELGLFAKAILDEIAETDPEGVIYDEDPSMQPWAMLVPPPLRVMLDTGRARIDQGNFLAEGYGEKTTHDISYQENPTTHHVVDMFELNTPGYRYFYGKSLHYLRIFNCELPLTTEDSLHQTPLSEIVDADIFHHPSLVVNRVERNKQDLMLHLPRILYPSARPPL